MANDVFTLNAGSSSLKFSLWEAETGTELRELFRGEIEKIGIPHACLRGSRVAAQSSTKDLRKAGPTSAMRTFCASSSPGCRSSAGTGSRP